MNRREILRRRLRADVLWGLGNVGCHGAYADGRPARLALADPTLGPGEPFYVVTLDSASGNISVAPGDVEQPEV